MRYVGGKNYYPLQSYDYNDSNSSSDSNQNICKLRCGCEIHASCFTDYVKHRLEDKVPTVLPYTFSLMIY